MASTLGQVPSTPAPPPAPAPVLSPPLSTPKGRGGGSSLASPAVSRHSQGNGRTSAKRGHSSSSRRSPSDRGRGSSRGRKEDSRRSKGKRKKRDSTPDIISYLDPTDELPQLTPPEEMEAVSVYSAGPRPTVRFGGPGDPAADLRPPPPKIDFKDETEEDIWRPSQPAIIKPQEYLASSMYDTRARPTSQGICVKVPVDKEGEPDRMWTLELMALSLRQDQFDFICDTFTGCFQEANFRMRSNPCTWCFCGCEDGGVDFVPHGYKSEKQYIWEPIHNWEKTVNETVAMRGKGLKVAWVVRMMVGNNVFYEGNSPPLSFPRSGKGKKVTLSHLEFTKSATVPAASPAAKAGSGGAANTVTPPPKALLPPKATLPVQGGGAGGSGDASPPTPPPASASAPAVAPASTPEGVPGSTRSVEPAPPLHSTLHPRHPASPQRIELPGPAYHGGSPKALGSDLSPRSEALSSFSVSEASGDWTPSVHPTPQWMGPTCQCDPQQPISPVAFQGFPMEPAAMYGLGVGGMVEGQAPPLPIRDSAWVQATHPVFPQGMPPQHWMF